jgi:hypothetical protein
MNRISVIAGDSVVFVHGRAAGQPFVVGAVVVAERHHTDHPEPPEPRLPGRFSGHNHPGPTGDLGDLRSG